VREPGACRPLARFLGDMPRDDSSSVPRERLPRARGLRVGTLRPCTRWLARRPQAACPINESDRKVYACFCFCFCVSCNWVHFWCPFPACWRAVLVSLFCVLARCVSLFCALVRCLGVSCRHAGALSWCLFPACWRAAPASFRRLYRVSRGTRKSAPARTKGSSAPARRKMPLSCVLARCPGVSFLRAGALSWCILPSRWRAILVSLSCVLARCSCVFQKIV